jgi:hypothetical protein
MRDFCPLNNKHCYRNCKGFECKKREEEKEAEQRAAVLYPLQCPVTRGDCTDRCTPHGRCNKDASMNCGPRTSDRGTNIKDLVAHYFCSEVAVIGDYVEKIGGSYQAKGFLRSIFTNEAGDLRAVVEFESHAGMLHIYNFGQLRLIRRRM